MELSRVFCVAPTTSHSHCYGERGSVATSAALIIATSVGQDPLRRFPNETTGGSRGAASAANGRSRKERVSLASCPISLPRPHPASSEFAADAARPAQTTSRPAPANTRSTRIPHAIFLDIDGTLLDIAPTPLEVKVSDALRGTLASLSEHFDGAIAFVSGRPIAEMDRLFDPLRLAAVGGHGAEIRFAPDGDIRRSEIATLDEDLRAEFSRIGRIGDGVIVEDKGYSLAIHYRLAPHLGGEIMKGVTAVCKSDRCERARNSSRQGRDRDQARRLRQGHRPARDDERAAIHRAQADLCRRRRHRQRRLRGACRISPAPAFRSAASCPARASISTDRRTCAAGCGT